MSKRHPWEVILVPLVSQSAALGHDAPGRDKPLDRLSLPMSSGRTPVGLALEFHGLRTTDSLVTSAEHFYKKGQSLNTLVVIDEAHRIAPRRMEREENGNATERAVRSTLIDAVRTTRKYGLGWLFISQTLSSLHTEIIQQLRIFFFGFGLGLGQEFMALRDLVGGSGPALDLYRLFRDPHSAFDTKSRQYSFMTIGPVSPLSFSGTPLFFNAYNTVEEFLEQNGLGSLAERAPGSAADSIE